MGPNQREISIIVRAVDQVSGAMTSATRGVSNFVAKSTAMLKKFAVVGLGVGTAIGYMARRVAASGANLAESAKSAGVTAEALSRLRIAYDFVGDQAEDADDILKRLNKTMGDVARGDAREARFVIEALGLRVEELVKMRPDQALLTLARAFDQLESSATRSSAAAAIFGKGVSEKFLRGLVDGSDELTKMVAEAEKFGRVLTSEDAETLRGLDDDFKKAAGAIEKAATVLVVKLAPAITKILDLTTKLVTLFEDFPSALSEGVQALLQGRFTAYGIIPKAKAIDKAYPPSEYGAGGMPAAPKAIGDAEAKLSAFNKEAEKASNALDDIIAKWSDFQATAIGGAADIIDMGLEGIVDSLADVITGVKSAKEAFKELGRAVVTELIRIAIRLGIVAGLSALIPGAGGFLGGGLLAKAKGGVVQGNMVPLTKYAAGGVANSPQLALFGEGAGAEAFVPLPDGKTIPVTMRGGRGAQVNITIQAIDTQTGVEWLVENRAAIGQIIAGEMAGSSAMRSAVRGIF